MKKKYSLLVAISMAFLVVMFLSWVIPGGTFYSGAFTKGDYVSIGLYDLFNLPMLCFAYAYQFTLVFLMIGGFYGVINKTSVYSQLLDKISHKYKENKTTFLIITVLTLSLLSALLGSSNYIFILVPFFITALLKLGYGKKTALLATIGSLLAGSMGSIYGFDTNGYITYYLSLSTSQNIALKIILFAVIVALLILFLINNRTEEDTVKEEEIPLYEKTKNSKKSFVPLVVISLLGVLICLVGVYSWKDAFNLTFFEDSYKSLTDLSINGYPIVKNIIGSIGAMGAWSSSNVNIMLIIMSLVIGWLYNIKFKETLEGFIDGAKKMLPVFIYTTLANVIFVVIINYQQSSFANYTIINYLFGLTKGFNAFTFTLIAAVNSFFINYFPHYASDTLQIASMFYTNSSMYPLMGFIVKTVYGLLTYVLPTSLLLVAGLAYLNVSYKEWIKYIWKYVLYLFGAVIVFLLIASAIL